jgi:DNA polymerase I
LTQDAVTDEQLYRIADAAAGDARLAIGILLTAKQRLEAGGWRVVHSIVDSIWVTPDPDTDAEDRTPLETLAAEITETVGIRLEYEAAYEWVAFVPQRHSDTGALTKYFGKLTDEAGVKLRGIEARQRSTSSFVETIQRACLDRFAATRSPEAVIDRLHQAITRLHTGGVAPDQLVEEVCVSKPLDAYTHATRTVAALERARAQDIAPHPGQRIRYIVVDDAKSTRDRVAFVHEHPESYDAEYYETQLIRAVESLLSPLNWDRTDIQCALNDYETPRLATFVESQAE